MDSVLRRGDELRAAVRRRRLLLRLVLAVQVINLCLVSAIAIREQGGLFAWVAGVLLAVVALGAVVVVSPRVELRAIRQEIRRRPLNADSRRRVTRISVLVGSAVALAALVVEVLLDSWLTGIAVALAIVLMSALFALFTALAGRNR